jgi:hypothetical protein
MPRFRGTLLVALVALGSLGTTSPVHASSAALAAPCADVAFDYFPHRVTIGGTMDMDLSVTNCSSMRERLFLEVEWSGPCRFSHPTPKVYELEAGEGFGQSSVVLTPECTGTFRTRVRLTMQGQALDRDQSRFVSTGAI